jgi:acyl carrier protein
VSDELEQGIAEIVAEVAEIEPTSIDPQATLAQAGIDSLMSVEIAVDVERRYGIHFEEAELKRIATFADLVAQTRAKLVLPTQP